MNIPKECWDRFLSLVDEIKAEANAQQETYISVGEAMKLGAGNFEVLCEDGKWRTGTQDCPYRDTWGGRVIKYRAIQPQAQPEPVEPPAWTGSRDDVINLLKAVGLLK